MAYRVTARNASSIRYQNPSACFLSKTYSRTRPCCARAIRSQVSSSCCVLGTLPTALCLPNSEDGSTKESAVPPRPARAVRPTRCVYARAEDGKSKLRTQATSRKSIPRATPYSLSDLTPWRFLWRPDFAGGVGARLRLRRLGPGTLSASESRRAEANT